MHTENTKTISEKSKKWKYEQYAERKWNHINCSSSPQNAKKEGKSRNKNKGNSEKTIMKMVVINPIISIAILNISGLNKPIKTNHQSRSKNKTQVYVAFNKTMLNIKSHIDQK